MNDYRDYLSHHGINGQKWGVRNGPPYPLSAGAHSAREKKAGWRQSLKGKSESKEKGTGVRKDGFKKQGMDPLTAYYIAAAAVYTTAFAASFALTKMDTYRVQSALNKIRNKRITEMDESTGFRKRNEKNKVEKDLKNVNPTYDPDVAATATNCVFCTATVEMRRRGYDVNANLQAKQMNGMKEMSSIFPGGKAKYDDSFDILDKSKSGNDGPEINRSDPYLGSKLQKARTGAMRGENTKHADAVIRRLSSEKDSRGALFITWPYGGGHAVSYEVKGGKVRIIDGQINKIYSEKESKELLSKTILAFSYRYDNLEVDYERAKKAMG